MPTRVRVHRPLVSDLPEDFGERLEEFRVAGGLTVRSLARLLGVSPHRVREWRRGVAPASRHLFLLLMIAGQMGLRGLLERPGDDLPAEVERQIAAARRQRSFATSLVPPRRNRAQPSFVGRRRRRDLVEERAHVARGSAACRDRP